MNVDLQQQLTLCSAHRKSRDRICDYVLERPALFPELVSIAFDIDDKVHFKACWILELVAYKKLEWFQEYLEIICTRASLLQDQSGIRPVAKVLMMVVKAHFSKKNNAITLSENQLEQLTEVCFDWLISNTKVAAKAYAIYTLYTVGKKYDWIHPELKIILEKEYENHTPAYKSVAREILKKINQ